MLVILGNPPYNGFAGMARGRPRPTANNNEGSTPALGNDQARALLDAPPEDTLKGKRDRAILATLLYHGIREAELVSLKVRISSIGKACPICASRERAAKSASCR